PPVNAKLKEQIWLLRASKPVPAVQRVCSSENLRKTALQGGFFVSRERDYDATDRISRRSSVIFDRYGIKDCNAKSILDIAAATTTTESSQLRHERKEPNCATVTTLSVNFVYPPRKHTVSIAASP
uniref:hypothetical protein n=1 Tax=Escherichia coli TaxID=562 RepID=UPI001BC89BB6